MDLPILKVDASHLERKDLINQFVKYVDSYVNQINKTIENDDQHKQAKTDVKQLKTLENKVKEFKKRLFTHLGLDDLDNSLIVCSKHRIPLENDVKNFTKKRKESINHVFYVKANQLVDDIKKNLFYHFDFPVFDPTKAVFGKKTTDSYLKAIESYYHNYKKEVEDFIHLMSVRSKVFHEISEGYEFLFHDASNIIQRCDTSIMRDLVKSRISEYKLSKHQNLKPSNAVPEFETIEQVDYDTGEVVEFVRPVEMITIKKTDLDNLVNCLRDCVRDMSENDLDTLESFDFAKKVLKDYD